LVNKELTTYGNMGLVNELLAYLPPSEMAGFETKKGATVASARP